MEIFGLLYLTILYAVCSAQKTMTVITLFNAKRTWNDAILFCQGKGMQLLEIRTKEKADVIDWIDSTDTVWYNKFQDSWIALHDADSTTRYGHSWVKSCTPMSTSWADWYTDEPLNHAVSKCVKIVKDNPGFAWRAQACNQKLMVMCEMLAGPCTFESVSSTTVANALEDVTEMTDLDTCKSRCRTALGSTQGECWAFSYESISQLCTLHIATQPLFFDSIINKVPSLVSITLYVKRCYKGQYDGTDDQNSPDTSSDPNTGCQEGQAMTTLPPSTATPLTTATNTAATTTAATTTSTTTTAESTVATTTTTTATTTPTTFTTTATSTTVTTAAITTTATTTVTATTATATVTTSSSASTPSTATATDTSTTAATATESSTTNIATATDTSTTAATATTTDTSSVASATADTSTSASSITTSATAATVTTGTALSTLTTTATGSSATTAATSLTTATTTYTAVTSSSSTTAVASTTSTTLGVQNLLRLEICGCSCSPPGNKTIEERIEEIIARLTVNKKTTSKSVRKKISAPDDRPSAQNIGYSGIVMLVLTCSLFVFSDAGRLCAFMFNNKGTPGGRILELKR